MACYIAFDLGGSSIKTGIVTDRAELLAHGKYPVPEDFDALLGFIGRLTEKARADYGVRGAAISSAGCIDPAEGVVRGLIAPSLQYLIGRCFYDLRPRLAVPVRAEKDGVAAAYGEYWAGGAKGCENFLTLVLGTGLGGAVFIGGKPYRGAHFFAGDMGYIAPAPGMPGYSFLTAPVPYEARYFQKTGRRLSCSGLYAARETDPDAAELWDAFIQNVAGFCIQMQFTFDPEAVFIGGGISGWPPFIPLLRAEAARQAEQAGLAFNVPDIRACTGGNDANLLGAVYGLKTEFGI